MVKNLPAMRKTWVQLLDWEDPLEEDIATHSSILAWRIPMDRGAWQAPWDHKELDTTEELSVQGLKHTPKPPMSFSTASISLLFQVDARNPMENSDILGEGSGDVRQKDPGSLSDCVDPSPTSLLPTSMGL